MTDLAMTTPVMISARLDRLPPTRTIWRWVILLALGGFFEIYEVGMTASMGPGLVAAGIFEPGRKGLFGLPDLATFAFATFAGVYLGCVLFGRIADRWGRKPVFMWALLWYSLATAVMAFQNDVTGICAWRFVAGIGVGIEIVVIDCYLAEVVPKSTRGRGFAVAMSVQFLAAPVGGILAGTLIPAGLFGVPGWRLLALVPAIGAVLVWWLRRGLPESPRWLAEHGRGAEAGAILDGLEADAENQHGATLAAALPAAPPAPGEAAASMWKSPIRGRMIMIIVGQSAGVVAYFGFANWIPSMLLSQGVSITRSLVYTAAIAMAHPLSFLLISTFADRFERKWQIMAGSAVSGIAGLLFAQQSTALGWITLGVVITLSNNLFSFGTHAYQAELFPTHIRARAVGFVYSFTRIAAAFSSYLFAWTLSERGVPAVFELIAACMLICIIAIGFGPRTLGRSPEEIDGHRPFGAVPQ